MLSWLAAAAAASIAALLVYGGRGARMGPLAPLAAALRFAAILLLAAALLDAPLGRARAARPFVALDVSASWRRGGDTTAWRDARRLVRDADADSLLLFGDSVRAAPIPGAPGDRASRLRPAVERALAAGRPLVVVTDGEVADADAAGELPGGSRIEIAGAAPRPDAAVAELEAPRTAVAGDSVDVSVRVRGGGAGSGEGTLTLRLGGRTLRATAIDSIEPWGDRTVDARVPATSAPGAVPLLAIVETAGDAEPRNDTLAVALDVSRAAGAVFVSTSPDVDARFVVDLLRGALALPTRGYWRVAPGQWRSDETLAPVPEAEVRQALREAPIVVLHGDTALFGAPREATRGALALVAPPREPDGDWYVAQAPPSPLSGGLASLPFDSLPPLSVARSLPDGEWVGLTAARGRTGDRRAVVTGSGRGRRVVVVGASGFGRWRFRGGASAEAFSAIWGGIVDWLAAGRTDARAAIPAEGVLREGEPVRWRRGGEADSVARAVVRRRGDGRADTMLVRFPEGASIAETPPLAAGLYDVETEGGTSLLVVNVSPEWLPRRPTLRAGTVGAGSTRERVAGSRDSGWVYLAALVLLASEWLLRRRLGLR
ncbi:MAG TPA: hypothetical protein VFZ11_07220 [Gemmatimonadaceae bacterium]